MTANSEAEQLELIAAKAEPTSVELQEEVARRCRTRQEAIRKTYEYSQLSPQQVYSTLGWSQGQFSKVIAGHKSLPNEDYHRYQTLCGNWILLRYDAWMAKHEIRPIKTDAEARIKELEAELADRDRAITLLGDLLRGKK